MREDPVEWPTRQWQAGVDLREEGRYLRTQDTDDWERRAAEWAQELRDGIAIRSPRDVGRVVTLGKLVVEDLPPEHPWHDSRILPWPHMTATGEGRPSNNPYSRHSALVAEVKKILNEWRATCPKAPKPASTKIPYDEFERWYLDRARNAKPGDRSSREEECKAAEKHFQCHIPVQWPREARQKLSDSHTYKTKGRRPS